MRDHTTIAQEINLMQDLLLNPAAIFPDKAAILQLEGSWSFGRLLKRARQYAKALQISRVSPGEPVGILMENSPEYVAAYFGIFLSGGVAVPLDCKAQPQILADIFSGAGLVRLLASEPQLHIVTKILKFPQLLRWIVSSSTATKFQLGLEYLNVDMLQESSLDARCDPQQPAIINYTSGSSGRPKGVTLSHHAILSNTRSIIAYLELTPEDRVMQILPFFYCYGASLLHTHFMVGASVVIDNRFLYPGAVLSNMKETHCTGFAGVPSTFHTLATKCELKGAQFPQLRYVTQAGGRLAPDLVDTIRSAIAPARLFVMYGQTEASARLTYLPPERWIDKRGSVGKAIPGVTLKVADETGNELPQGDSGEVWVTGENIMTGYWNRPDETAQVLVDGWLRTGDLGHMDQEGFLFIDGRVNSIIKSSGYRVSPYEVEEVLYRHPAVNEAAVFGIPDPQLGEQIAAVLSVKNGQSTSVTELTKHCKTNLPSYKVPRRLVLVPELPKSASGKLQREILRQLLEQSGT